MTDAKPEAPANYIDALAAEIGELAPCPEDLLRLYALLALTSGSLTSLEDVHDAWSAWMAGRVPGHRSLIPFADLSPDVQQMDAPYRDAIIKVARTAGGAGMAGIVISDEAVALLAAEGIVPVRQDDLRAVLPVLTAHASPVEDAACDRLEQAAAWQGMAACDREAPAGAPATFTEWGVAYEGDEQPGALTGIREYDDREDAERIIREGFGDVLVTRTVTATPWQRAEAAR